MKGYIEITSQADLDALVKRVVGFYDSIGKELHFSNRGWVDEDLSMMMGHRFDLRLLVQSQWEPGCIELLFIGIEEFFLNDPCEYWCASGQYVEEMAPVERSWVSMNFDGKLKVRATRMFFIDRPDWTGPATRFGSEIPRPECVPATTLSETWRQCSECADAFETVPGLTYAVCPTCHRMTQIDRE